MNTNELEARLAKLESAVTELQQINSELVNQEAVLRCMMYTLLSHMSDDQRTAMAATYGTFLSSALETIPPHIQNREILEEFEVALSPGAPGKSFSS